MIALFETMLVSRGRIVLADDHLARMTRSAEALGWARPDGGEFRRVTSLAASGDAVRCTYDGQRFRAEARPIPAATLARRAHGSAITVGALARLLPEHKLTGLYGICELGLQLATDAGAGEGLFVTRDGHVLEGTTTNVFAVTAHSLVTAPEHILPGVTRAWVLREAAALGIAVEERAPSVGELREGGFLTGSLTTLAPLRSIDGEACRPPGPIYARLEDRWSTLFGWAASASSR
jgi:branched-subunit amino acid aminotransferase/4-amino-4-deoxychorismate lyase